MERYRRSPRISISFLPGTNSTRNHISKLLFSYPVCASTGEITTRDSLGIQTLVIGDSRNNVLFCQMKNGTVYTKLQLPDKPRKFDFSTFSEGQNLNSLFIAANDSLYVASTEKALLSKLWSCPAQINDFIILERNKIVVSTEDAHIYLLNSDKLEKVMKVKEKIRKLIYKDDCSILALFNDGTISELHI